MEWLPARFDWYFRHEGSPAGSETLNARLTERLDHDGRAAVGSMLARQLVCPRDAHDLTIEFAKCSSAGTQYPVFGGIPILLIPKRCYPSSCDGLD